jgi:hypothetical protein
VGFQVVVMFIDSFMDDAPLQVKNKHFDTLCVSPAGSATVMFALNFS